jgi:hypothetical protein
MAGPCLDLCGAPWNPHPVSLARSLVSPLSLLSVTSPHTRLTQGTVPLTDRDEPRPVERPTVKSGSLRVWDTVRYGCRFAAGVHLV